MPAIGYSFNFLQGLSDFWQRFFADADQLESMYKGSAILMGQAYLDLMSATLGIALKDAVAIDREYYRLVPIREDEMRYVKGATGPEDRWAFNLPDPVVDMASIDNRVFEPTASLEPQRDFDVINRVALFKVDPTDPTGSGLPLNGFARRTVDVATGGKFVDLAASAWPIRQVRKGDTLRILDVGTDGSQRKRADYPIVLVREDAIYVDTSSPLPAPITNVKYAILRVPPVHDALDSFTLVGEIAPLLHARIDQGSVRIYAKNASGEDVVEDVDYVINYEDGEVTRIGGTPWNLGNGPYSITYTFKTQVTSGTTGAVSRSGGTARAVQIAAWAPDARVDRRTLANNFGVLIGREADSSEAYRAFLQGIFQLYLLGPVFERVESALNVVLNLPVVRDDGEVVQSIDTTDPVVDRVLTLRPGAVVPTVYEYPKGTPLRADLVAGLELLSFEPLTDAVNVTDYVETPNWWHGAVIPLDLFAEVNGQKPFISRRTASASYVEHVVGAGDDAEIGDPGLYVGGDETGFLPPPGQPIFRRRLAFVLMDQYMKHHTFSVSFDAAALSASAGVAFAQGLRDLNELVIASRPSHTYPLIGPETFFQDEVQVLEEDLETGWTLGSRAYGPDRVIFADDPPIIGADIWAAGDYFKYETFTSNIAFPTVALAVTMPNAPTAPRVGRFVRVYVAGTVGGKRVIENVDYAVDYANRTVARLTAWDSNTVNVTYVQLNIGHVADAAIGAGDMEILVGGVDPALVTATFDPVAAQWDGTVTPTTAPRDIGMVERALIVYPHA